MDSYAQCVSGTSEKRPALADGTDITIKIATTTPAATMLFFISPAPPETYLYFQHCIASCTQISNQLLIFVLSTQPANPVQLNPIRG